MDELFADLDAPDPDGGDDLLAMVSARWASIRTYLRAMRVMTFLNVRLWVGEGAHAGGAVGDVWPKLRRAAETVGVSLKVNYSFGVILEHKTEGTLRYFHTSPNHDAELERPALVRTVDELRELFETADRVDVVERSALRRPNTQWKVRSVTNISFFLYHLNRAGRIGKPEIAIPRHLLDKRCVASLLRARGATANYEDNLCFFRCVALSKHCQCSANRCQCSHPPQNATLGFYSEFSRGWQKETSEILPKARDFAGVTFEHLKFAEILFDISIIVFENNEANTPPTIVWNSGKVGGKKLYVVLHGEHFCYVKNILAFSGTFSCFVCKKLFVRLRSLVSHPCDVERATTLVFENASFSPPPTVFDKLAKDVGILLPEQSKRDLTNKFRITYDIECYLPKENLPSNTTTMEFINEHKLLSVSVCSNVPPFTKPECFVTKGDSLECIGRFVRYLLSIARKARKLNKKKWNSVSKQLAARITEQRKREMHHKDAGFSQPGTYKSRVDFSGIKKQVDGYIRRVPVVGFNSQRYDLNVIKGELVRTFFDIEETIDYVIKKPGSFPCIQTRHFRFLDALNFVAAGFDYSKYLKAFECEMTKGFFPYEWMDNLEKLKHTSLPPPEAFHSALKNENITAENYAYCQRVWVDKKMETFKDFLVWYNNADVEPFLEALAKQAAVYATKGIDMLGSGISLPGLAVRWAHGSLQPLAELVPRLSNNPDGVTIANGLLSSQPILNTTTANKDLHRLFRDQLVGGPSIIFHRHQESGVTALRPSESDRLCSLVLGLDANSLYLWCIQQRMPTGHPVRRFEKNEFAAEKTSFSTSAHHWLSYVEYSEGVDIQHAHNESEYQVGRHGLPVDGVCHRTKTVYQFHGCYWHACLCLNLRGKHPTRVGVTCTEIRSDTTKKEQYIARLGWKLVVMRECVWRAFCQTDNTAKQFKKIFYNTLYKGYKKKETKKGILDRVLSGTFYGFVECDISVPAELRHRFADMAPIFKNVKVGREHLSESMREFAINNGHLSRPQRMLIGSLFGEKILLHTDLLQWYLRNGLVVSRVYQTIEHIPRKVFAKFASEVCDARRQADADPAKAIVGDTSKFIGNSLYGKTITNKEKHQQVNFESGVSDASLAISSQRFTSLEELSHDIYEVHRHPIQIKIDTATHVGFTILQLAKLRMLQFYYDCVDRFVPRILYQPMEMDTDSLYMATGGELDDIVRPELRENYFRARDKWFPGEACPAHTEAYIKARIAGDQWVQKDCCVSAAAYTRRTPGLF